MPDEAFGNIEVVTGMVRFDQVRQISGGAKFEPKNSLG